MGREKYLIDTNVAIEYIGGTLPLKSLNILDDIINDIFYISVINKIELLGFAGLSAKEDEQFRELIDNAVVLNIDDNIVETTIKMRKIFRIKLPDAIIAATAVENNLVLLTRNLKDFKRITNLKSLNLYE
jgi:predicted nucleic acid-binding protein